ncbi:hypothetical protein A4A28_02260 [Staphylococcus hominis]|nr:hypothetical protein [Staphylococcus hominis]KAF1677184.1 hypothetical protein A4A31_09135 [Staphylococcus hominis]OIS42186.1 hypothetical protein A4A25_10680 [Staphylococcus hominis]OIS53242.1 hypothetical protein A4A28_02260 [Staphylococcus hominis]OIS53717.1 hypothetical protein A4A27_10795 [Staphylococcus hominis]
MDKAKSNAEDAAEKFKNNDNEQVDKVKDQINKYTGGKKDDTQFMFASEELIPHSFLIFRSM